MHAASAFTKLLLNDANSRYVKRFGVSLVGDTLYIDIGQEIDGPVNVDDVHDFYQSLIDTACHLLTLSESTGPTAESLDHVSIVFDRQYFIRVCKGLDGVIVVTRGDTGATIEVVQTIDPTNMYQWDDIVSCHYDSSNNEADYNDGFHMRIRSGSE